MTLSLFNERLNKMSIKSSEEDIVYPTLGIIWYLKSNNFDKKIYCLGTQSMKQELKEAGFDVVRSDVSLRRQTRRFFSANFRLSPSRKI